MCGANPNLPKAVNQAKCMGIVAFVFSIFSLIGFLISVPGAIGGLITIVASSILMCCGPKPGDNNTKLLACFVMFILGGILHILGALLCIIWYIGLVADADEWCDDWCSVDTWYQTAEQCCEDHKAIVIGWSSVLVIPNVVINVIALIFELIAAAKCWSGKKEMTKGITPAA